jgi:hypothetical protein
MEMAEQESEGQANRKGSRRIFWGRVVAVSFIVMALVSYLKDSMTRLPPPISRIGPKCA